MARIWPGAMQDAIELEEFLQVVRDVGAKKILEIGTCGGGTAAALASTGAKVVTMDIVKAASYPWETEEYKKEFPNASVTFIHGDSRPWHMPSRVRDDYDIVFIDGDHTNFSQYTDFKHYGKMGKVVVIHDINQWKTRTQDDWFPRNFWRLLIKDGSYKTKEIQSPTNVGGAAGIGVIYMKSGDYEKLLKMFEGYLFNQNDQLSMKQE